MTRLALNKPILTIGGKRPAGNGAGTRFVPINPEAFIAHSIVPWVGCRTGVYRSGSSIMPRRPGENWLPAGRCAQLSECAGEPARQSHSLRFHMEICLERSAISVSQHSLQRVARGANSYSHIGNRGNPRLSRSQDPYGEEARPTTYLHPDSYIPSAHLPCDVLRGR